MTRDELLAALEQLLKTEPNAAIRRAASGLYLKLTETRKAAA